MSENGTAEQWAMPKHGQFCWTEIATTNLETAKTFYAELFGWKFQESTVTEGQMKYLEYGPENGSGLGGMYELSAETCPEGASLPPPHFMNYIAVDDVDEAASKVFELGGKIVVPPMEIPKVGRFTMVEDPTGAKFSMITLQQPG